MGPTVRDKTSELAQVERDAMMLKRQIRQLGRPPTDEERAQIRSRGAEIRDRAAKAMVNKLIVDRPEVVSRGKPVSGAAAKRGQVEARTRLERKPEFRACSSRCPAAQVSQRADGAVMVVCRVEGTVLTSSGDPQSMLTFCMGSYDSCPSWVAEREAQEAGKQHALAS